MFLNLLIEIVVSNELVINEFLKEVRKHFVSCLHNEILYSYFVNHFLGMKRYSMY